MKISKLPGIEFKIMVMKMLRMEEHSEKSNNNNNKENIKIKQIRAEEYNNEVKHV